MLQVINASKEMRPTKPHELWLATIKFLVNDGVPSPQNPNILNGSEEAVLHLQRVLIGASLVSNILPFRKALFHPSFRSAITAAVSYPAFGQAIVYDHWKRITNHGEFGVNLFPT